MGNTTSINATITSCGPSQPISLQYTCLGVSCVDLNSFPNTNCTVDSDGATLDCSNNIICPGPTNYTSSINVEQTTLAGNAVWLKQVVSLSDLCQEITVDTLGEYNKINTTVVPIPKCNPAKHARRELQTTLISSTTASSRSSSSSTTSKKSSSTSTSFLTKTTTSSSSSKKSTSSTSLSAKIASSSNSHLSGASVKTTSSSTSATKISSSSSHLSSSSTKTNSPGTSSFTSHLLSSTSRLVSPSSSSKTPSPSSSHISSSSAKSTSHSSSTSTKKSSSSSLHSSSSSTISSTMHLSTSTKTSASTHTTSPSTKRATSSTTTHTKSATSPTPTPEWLIFANLFIDYLADLSSPEIADNLVAEVNMAVCNDGFNLPTSENFASNLIESCVSAMYIQSPDVAPEVEFMSIFGATILCNMLIAEALPGVQSLTEPICQQPKPCSEELLTDPKNCGSCGNVCATGECINGACTSSACTGETCSTFTNCGPGGDCVCASTTENTGYCVDGATLCLLLSPCGETSDCGTGEVCAVDSCCPTGVCIGATYCGGSKLSTRAVTNNALFLREAANSGNDTRTIGSCKAKL